MSETTTRDAAVGTRGAGADLSWIQQVRHERDERVAEETIKFGVPTWGTEDEPTLAIEVGVISRIDMERYAKKARKVERRGGSPAGIDVDFICKATEAVWMRNPETDKLVKIEVQGMPVRIDKRLAELLHVDGEEAGRDSHALMTYLVRGNGIALAVLAQKIFTWMQNTTAEIDGAIVGE